MVSAKLQLAHRAHEIGLKIEHGFDRVREFRVNLFRRHYQWPPFDWLLFTKDVEPEKFKKYRPSTDEASFDLYKPRDENAPMVYDFHTQVDRGKRSFIRRDWQKFLAINKLYKKYRRMEQENSRTVEDASGDYEGWLEFTNDVEPIPEPVTSLSDYEAFDIFLRELEDGFIPRFKSSVEQVEEYKTIIMNFWKTRDDLIYNTYKQSLKEIGFPQMKWLRQLLPEKHQEILQKILNIEPIDGYIQVHPAPLGKNGKPIIRWIHTTFSSIQKNIDYLAAIYGWKEKELEFKRRINHRMSDLIGTDDLSDGKKASDWSSVVENRIQQSERINATIACR